MDQMTEEERLILEVVRHNRATPKLEISRTWRVGRFSVTYLWRSRKNPWGRFGGGWNWIVGAQVGRTNVILNLLVFSLTFRYHRPR